MKPAQRLAVVIFLTLTTICFGAVPSTFGPRGVGGGGALFCPSINPANDNEYYVACDMSELFHTTDFGASYSLMPFQQIQGGNYALMQFTSDPSVRYCVTNANDAALPAISTDAGVTWTTLPGNPDATETTYSLFADYNNPGRVVISYYGSIYFSSDRGAHFADIHDARNSGSGVVVGGVFFNGSTIVIGSSDGLIVSGNGGSTFSNLTTSGIPPGEEIFSFAGAVQGNVVRFFCLTGDTGSIYVGLAGSDYWGFVRGVYSMDYPSTAWTSRIADIQIGTDFPMYVAMAKNDVNTCYCAGGSSSGSPNVLKTINAGASWTHVFNAAGNQNVVTGWSGQGGDRGWGYGECAMGFAVAPLNSDKVLISDFGFVHKSSDGGASWQQAYVAAGDQHPAGTATPAGKSYHSAGLENTSCWQVSWFDSVNMFACFSDIKAVRSTDAGVSWSFNFTGDNANTMYRCVSANSGVVYAATSGIHDMYQSTRLADAQLDANDASGAIISSADKGATWQTVHTFNHPVFWVALDPSDQKTMYASVIHSTLGGVFVSHDIQNGATSTWTKLPNPPRTQGHPASIVVLKDGSIVATYSGRRTTAFTASSGVFIYTTASSSWSDVSDPGMQYWTKDIVVDPFDVAQNTWYVGVFSGWGGAPNGLGGLYKTVNRGGKWTKINNLDRVTSVTINPTDENEAYLTTETEGLWHTANLAAAAPAFALVDSYPFRQPERVFFNPFNKSELWVSSFGNGLRVGSLVSAATAPLSQKTIARESFSVKYRAEKIMIEMGGNGGSQTQILVTTLEGKVVYRSSVMNGVNGIFLVDIGKLGKGVYVVRARQGAKDLTKAALLSVL
jgi:hypothetical protein